MISYLKTALDALSAARANMPDRQQTNREEWRTAHLGLASAEALVGILETLTAIRTDMRHAVSYLSNAELRTINAAVESSPVVSLLRHREDIGAAAWNYTKALREEVKYGSMRLALLTEREFLDELHAEDGGLIGSIYGIGPATIEKLRQAFPPSRSHQSEAPETGGAA